MANEPEEKIRIRIDYSVAGKAINYTVAGILSLGGYGIYHSRNSSEENSYKLERYVIALQRDVKELKLNMKIFTVQLAEQNRKAIEKIND